MTAQQLSAAVTRAVTEIGGPLVGPLLRVSRGGGKLLRPMLTRAVAQSGGRDGDDPDVIALAAAAELLHCATLVHDDVIDDASVRRGMRTINAWEGVPAAIVGGDLLIAAAGVTAAEADPAAAVIIFETLGWLCRGEALQESLRYRSDISTVDLLAVAGAKTGALLQAACRLGALTFPADARAQVAVAGYGYHFGISLQLLDDLLDIVSTPELAGKAVGVDFVAGNLTLPAILALRDDPRLPELFRPDSGPADDDLACKLLAESDVALADTIQTAGDHARRAGRCLQDGAPANERTRQLSEWPAKYVASQLATKVGERHRWLVPEFRAVEV